MIHDPTDDLDRRTVLRAAGATVAVSVAGLAGCAEPEDGGGGTPGESPIGGTTPEDETPPPAEETPEEETPTPEEETPTPEEEETPTPGEEETPTPGEEETPTPEGGA